MYIDIYTYIYINIYIIILFCTTCTNASAGRQTNESSTKNTHMQILYE